jgi:glycosyltransferase involved in cell wall biosynthesis
VRYAYEQFDLYFPPGRTHLRALKTAVIARLRAWDIATASRPTRYLANSSAVAERIARHYGRSATVCHPPVDVEFFRPAEPPAARGSFLLAVGALVPYKRFEVAIAAAGLLGRRLVLVGRGPDFARLRALATGDVEILGPLAPEELRRLYRTCSVYLQPGEEDFGISAVEALACGAPVVALNRGGARDIVHDGVNGILCDEDGPGALAEAVRRSDGARFDYTRLRASALPFRGERFAAEFRGALGDFVG